MAPHADCTGRVYHPAFLLVLRLYQQVSAAKNPSNATVALVIRSILDSSVIFRVFAGRTAMYGISTKYIDSMT
jgi:hypothetical protein